MSIFVGRSAELRQLLRLLEAAQDGTVRDVVGVQGIGKSSYLSELSREASRSLDQALVLPVVDIKRYGLGEGFVDDFGATASTAVLWETLTSSRALMLRLTEPFGEFEDFRRLCREQSQHTRPLAEINFTTGKGSRLEEVTFVNNVSLATEEVRRRIREAQGRLDDAFIECWTSFTRGRHRVLVTLDSFELVADDEVGHWMTRLALRLPETLTVFARTPSEYEIGAKSPRFERMQLGSLILPEVAEVLARLLYPEPVPAHVADLVFGKTGGHPGGVTLVADLIAESGGPSVPYQSLQDLLEHLPPDPEHRWAELVNRTLDTIKRPLLRRAVEAAATASTFDEPLLRDLLSPGEGQPADVEEVIEQLNGLGFLTRLPPLPGQQHTRFRLHEFIQHPVAAQLRTQRPQRWRELSQRAAEHYFEILRNWDDDSNSSFSQGYRFENPGWQEQKREWLRHSGALADQRDLTRTRFVLVFFEALWWWGCYLHFPFTRRLIEAWTRASNDWEQPVPAASGKAQRKTPDQQLSDALTFIVDNYPTGSEKPPDAPWDEIRGQLLLVRRLCGLHAGRTGGPASKRRPEEERADAFITVFLAHTRMYRDPHDPRGDQYLRAAQDSFKGMKDAWNEAWIICHRADLALRRGDLRAARTLAGKGAVTLRDFIADTGEVWDHELLAGLHCVLAEARWAEGDLASAGAGYGRAVAHAYWYQGEPNPPDEYTQQLYAEMTGIAAGRLRELAGDPQGRDSFLAGMRGKLPADEPVPFLSTEAGDMGTVAFAPGPADEELRVEGSGFMDHWSVRYEDREDPGISLDELCAAGDEPAQR